MPNRRSSPRPELANWRMWNDPCYLATLAAAYSETSDYAAAVKWQERAINNLDLRDHRRTVYLQFLDCYRSGKPYRAVGSWQSMSLREE